MYRFNLTSTHNTNYITIVAKITTAAISSTPSMLNFVVQQYVLLAYVSNYIEMQQRLHIPLLL